MKSEAKREAIKQSVMDYFDGSRSGATVERVVVLGDAVHVYGQMPYSTERGLWYAGDIQWFGSEE